MKIIITKKQNKVCAEIYLELLIGDPYKLIRGTMNQ